MRNAGICPFCRNIYILSRATSHLRTALHKAGLLSFSKLSSAFIDGRGQKVSDNAEYKKE